MTVSIGTLLRVIEVCADTIEEEPLISLVFPKKGGGSAQIYLHWREGKTLRDYIRDISLTGAFHLSQAIRSRILDHNHIKRRLTHVPSVGDEIRFVRV